MHSFVAVGTVGGSLATMESERRLVAITSTSRASTLATKWLDLVAFDFPYPEMYSAWNTGCLCPFGFCSKRGPQDYTHLQVAQPVFARILRFDGRS